MEAQSRKRIVAFGGAGMGIAAGSLLVAALNPLAIAGAQTTTTTPPAAAAPADKGAKLDSVLAPLVADGTLTQAQADKVKAAFEAARPADGMGRHGRGGPAGIGRGVALDEAAAFLGTDAASLRTQLQSGKSLGEIAGDKKDALIASLVASANKRIDDAVTAGKLSADQATQLKSNTQQRITDMVNNVKPARPAR